MPFQPINMGNILAQSEQIKNARYARDPNNPRNAYIRAQTNALNDPAAGGKSRLTDPAAIEKEMQFLRYAIEQNYPQDQIDLIKQGISKNIAWMSDASVNRSGQSQNYINQQAAHGATLGGLLADSGQTPQPNFSLAGGSPAGGQMGQIPSLTLTPPTKGSVAADVVAAQQNAQAGLNPDGTPRQGATSEAEIDTEKAEARAEVEYKWKSLINAQLKEAEAIAKSKGEALTDLRRMEATLPGLNASVKKLKELGKVATYTKKGRAWDAAVRESGFGATEGATARAQFISIIDNQVLPLLRETFGAAFTAEEGLRLAATLGDVNLSPAEKDAQLDSFIAQKIKDVRTKKRLVQSLEADLSGNPQPENNDPLGIR